MFQIGDVVRLRNTKMKMTVESIDGESPSYLAWVRVVWFDRENQENRYSFQEFALEKVPQEEMANG